jgi:uncharacterized membrane protein YphA (DoxX/SURF4 family)
MNDVLLILGRLLLGGLFVMGGIRHFFIMPAVLEMMRARGVPYPKFVLIIGSIFQLVCGVLFVLGVAMPLTAAGLIIFTIVASIMLLNFWDLEPGPAREGAMGGFLCNMALIGGLLIAAVHSAPELAELAATPTVSQSATGWDVYRIGEASAQSGINVSERAHQSLLSYKGHQYAVYFNAGLELSFARRSLPAGPWATYTLSGVTSDDPDPHYAPVLGIDRDGYLFVGYNTRNSAIKWRRSSLPEDITAWDGEQTGMTGASEISAGFPMLVNGGPTGQPLLYFYREGKSGNADLMVNVWDEAAREWSALHQPLIAGAGASPNVSPYLWGIPYAADGTLHMFWCWRDTSDGSTNFNLLYARSSDGGVTWQRSDGTSYALPVTASNAEVVDTIMPSSNFANLGHAARSDSGIPHVAYFKNDASGIPQIFHAWQADDGWSIEQVSNRTLEFSYSGKGALHLPLARPGIEVYKNGDVLIIARDREYGNGLEFYRKSNGIWNHIIAGSEDLAGWGPQWDRKLFSETNRLDLLVQAASDVVNEEMDFPVPIAVWSFTAIE